ncbi:hypothetical protein [Litorimonas sp. WD9-15]|uniref:hypothetical protein n=1 Tax=Litorimonas sp. WD9-15 TaxID=3418716 RepID=UPI003D02378A
MYNFHEELMDEDFKDTNRYVPIYESEIDYWCSERVFYERKLTIAPFYGAGAGALAIGAAILSNPSNRVLEIILPSGWLFIISLMSMFIAGGFYVATSMAYANEYTVRGNAVRQFHNYRDKLVANSNKIQSSTYQQLLELMPAVKASINEKIVEANSDDKHGNIYLILARVISAIGILFFLFAIVSPMLVLSLSYDFGFIK